MGNNNNRTNNIIKWIVVSLDFLLLNFILALFIVYSPVMTLWRYDRIEIFVLVSNLALLASEWRYGTVIHQRMVSSGDVLRRITEMTIMQTVLSYLLLKVIDLQLPVGKQLLCIGLCMFVLLVLARFLERTIVKRYRMVGRNTRMVTFVGDDSELMAVYERLINNPTLGYRLGGYYGDNENWKINRLGSLDYLIENLNHPENLTIGDEMYVCLSRRDRDKVSLISSYCDHHLIKFYYVPMSVETLGVRLRRELLDDMEVFTTYGSPLSSPGNKFVKRFLDIVLSSLLLLFMLPFIPVIALIIKIQSPGPVFFKQLRTGLDGKYFEMIKFRSMHVNDDADRLQATKDDPRKFPFGDFMRKSNIDELPQFLNVLKGDMSIVGPRPHMLAHTEMYSRLIDKFMVRHFVKPGVTGWAQVTGFRGETHELWQMEGRVRQDIWYIENWSIWLDIRIIWLTFKSLFIHDKNAY